MMTQRWIWPIFGMWTIILIVGCGVAPTPLAEKAPPRSSPETGPNQTDQVSQVAPAEPALPAQAAEEEDLPPASPVPTPADPVIQVLVNQARADLAQRLAITLDQIELIEFELVVWPDGSLGCPQPGMAYIQVPQDGAVILLRVDDALYEYHSGGSRPPFLCEQATQGSQGSKPSVAPTKLAAQEIVRLETVLSDPAVQRLVILAQKDLVQRLSLSSGQVRIEKVEMVVWPDSSLGCPKPGMAYTQVQQDGLRIRLSAGGKIYHYHSGGNRDPFLCDQPAKIDGLVPPPGSDD
jgi:hypothetical protein